MPNAVGIFGNGAVAGKPAGAGNVRGRRLPAGGVVAEQAVNPGLRFQVGGEVLQFEKGAARVQQVVVQRPEFVAKDGQAAVNELIYTISHPFVLVIDG
ncbi:MAG TPA: hypothetical protein PKA28_09785 [Methylomusa anaerophila]|nr:hypothetical protein [Methylomusa anaerophila]HML88729.1 hypothetical protein [Methylomusa anaerophila]